MPERDASIGGVALPTEAQVLEALRSVMDPELGRDLVSLGMIKDIHTDSGNVRFTLVLTTPACPLASQIQDAARIAVMAVPGVEQVDVAVTSQVNRAQEKRDLIPGVRHTIAVASNKGGVGKSTVSVNLAVALAQTGAKVGLLDADITGPNIPLMMGLKTMPVADDGMMVAPTKYGISVMSIGFFLEDDAPVIWRGPLIGGAIKQLLEDVAWGELDYLIVDLPPGTSYASLTLGQIIPLSGVVIVTTPQDVSLMDAKKAISMFRQLNVPILGIVENMSYFVCPHCHERTDIFAHGGGRKTSDKLSVPFLGEIPLDLETRISADGGRPIVEANPTSTQADVFRAVAGAVAARVSVLQAGVKRS